MDLELVAKALRSVQMFDEVNRDLWGRPLLIDAEDALGKLLGLECSGVPEPGGYSHNGGTCPVHEWLRPEDQEEVTEKFARPTGMRMTGEGAGLICDKCGRSPWWSIPRQGDSCPDCEGHLFSPPTKEVRG